MPLPGDAREAGIGASSASAWARLDAASAKRGSDTQSDAPSTSQRARHSQDGPRGLVSKRRGRPSNRRLSSERRREALEVVRTRYADFGPTLAHEKLTEVHELWLSVETLRGWMVEDGLWVPRARREPRGGAGETPFGRALSALNIDIICANTPAAKGCVERAHLTLQDRLVKELRLRGISDIESANVFGPEFIADYNRRFARAARSEHDAHRPLQKSDDPERIFSWQETRKVSTNLTVHYKRVLYVLDPTDAARAALKKRVGIEEREDGTLRFWHEGQELLATAFPKDHGVKPQGEVVENKRVVGCPRLHQEAADRAR